MGRGGGGGGLGGGEFAENSDNVPLPPEKREGGAGGGGDVAEDGFPPTVFDKIARKEIPVDVVAEDEEVLAFRDANPVAPTHILLVPKKRDGLTQLGNAKEKHKAILGHLLFKASEIANQLGLENGFRIVINDGQQAGQTVYHLHVHLIAGRRLAWPPG